METSYFDVFCFSSHVAEGKFHEHDLESQLFRYLDSFLLKNTSQNRSLNLQNNISSA